MLVRGHLNERTLRARNASEQRMNWTMAENNWDQFRGTVKARWFKLNDEQLAGIAGKRAALLGEIQQVYGITRADAEREIKAFEARNKNYRPK
jgi:uncharacterized protein YjbJ (UPF0337 family)